jgi:triosephosphate isomerase
MRKPIIAANWKMNKTIEEAGPFVRELAQRVASFQDVDVVVCPPFVSLAAVADALAGTSIQVGAQNVSEHEKGAYTSQISAPMLRGIASYVIIGHSECREYLHEDDGMINRKLKAALSHGLRPIFACGESLAVYDAGQTADFVAGQIRTGLGGISAEQMQSVVIAYEPIWAIGTGKAATVEIANDVTGHIRSVVESLYGTETADAIRIQYGGSVKPSNMSDYMSQPNVDGALVGGASLIVDDFASLVQAANASKAG